MRPAIVRQRMLVIVRVCVCATLALSFDAPAADTAGDGAADRPAGRPRIGLVLAGGGAKGGAHVGVLKVLEEQRVPIDCIAGTSMGALIGAGYAAGLPAAELERFIAGVNWSAVVGGVGRRPAEPIEQKQLATAASTPLELGFQNGKIVTPGGLSDTSGIDDLLRTYVARARMVADFDQLPIPFRAVATDMVTGRMVVLKSGDLATAMRASMAIPGAFAPVIGNGYILADGGMVRNIPVDVARETCADVVIVVNLVETSVPPEKLQQATQLLARSMSVMLEANEEVQLQTLTERDVRIDVPMGDIGTADFLRVPETIPLGEQAARAAAARLAEYSVPAEEYAAWRTSVTVPQRLHAKVADVTFEGLGHVNPEYLRSRTSIRPGDEVSIDAISADALKMSALDSVESVAYRLEGDPANPTLVWMPQELPVGPDVLRPSMGIYAAGGGDLNFLLGVQHVRYWLNDRGAQWRNQLQVGYETLLGTSLYQPFDVAQRYFVEPQFLISRSAEDLYVDGDRVASYRFRDVGGRLDVGMNLSDVAQVRLGYLSTKRKATVQTGASDFLPEGEGRDAGFGLNFVYDSKDTATFATHGLAAAIEYQQSDTSLGADRNWDRVEAGVRTAVPIRRNVVWLTVAGGTDAGRALPRDRAFSLGGPRTLPAFQHDELRVGRYWLVDASVSWPVVELVALKNQSIYAGIGLQAAGLYERVDLVDDGQVYGASAYLAGPTPVGTFTVGVGVASETWGVWLALGRPIGKGSILDRGLFR
jgi:NTE family protein